ncbi:DUF4270 domain-containing protein [Flavobacterium qiangtangense]|uniref:DUF4270 domain-containing protein n=1 Tax=Flavobacterium qiangtangense TaxID=1442595 RepID=A0ABW1PRM7_9FLAO
MLNSSILKKFALASLGIFFLISCDKDFNEIGSDIVGEDHFGFERDSMSTLTAFTKKTGAVETSNLDINPLGILDNGKFGKTTANFVTQVSFPLGTENPTFTNVTLARIKSVVLNVPYFSTFKETNSDGANVYELDSIYGNLNQTFKLSVYENGYYLRNFDPNNNFEAQKYYSDQNAMFDAVKIGSSSTGTPVLNGAALNAGEEIFKFSPSELVTEGEEDEDDIKEAPGLRLNLNKQYFYNRIIDANSESLINNNIFQNYFRGLYFKVEEINGPAALAMLNFAAGTITISYEDETTASGVVDKTLVLNLSGNTVSLLTHTATTESSEYDIASGNSVSGDAKVFLKGGEGAITYIDLFGGGNSAELEELRSTAIANNWLINEAHIVFNVEQSAMANTIDPNRIYLYDATNRRAILDYNFDSSANTAQPKYAKTRYDGIAQLTGNSGDANRKAKKYRVRVTEHIKNIIFNDSTNVRLGLSVTESIANSATLGVKTPTTELKSVPQASVLSPLGTIIYGSNLPDTNAKKLRLVISFTKPD